LDAHGPLSPAGFLKDPSTRYISVEAFHLFRYHDEQDFRYNNRKLTDCERFTIIVLALSGEGDFQSSDLQKKQGGVSS
jgi:hypothetical protein